MADTLLSARDVRAAVSMPAAVDAVRQAFVDLHAGAFEMPHRTVLRDGGFLVMPVHHRPSATTAVKTLSLNGERDPAITGTVTWSDLGRREALVADAAAITSLRTGAVVGVATELLAAPDASSLVVVGAGGMAADQARAVAAVRPLRSVVVAGRTLARAEAVAAEVAESLGIETRATDDVRAAVAEADVVCCATPATEPLFEATDLRSDVHVNAVGSYRTAMRELPDALLAEAAPLLVDDVAAVLEEAGEVQHAIAAEVLAESDLVPLGAALAGARAARQSRTVFKSVGVAVQDWALARLLAESVQGRSR